MSGVGALQAPGSRLWHRRPVLFWGLILGLAMGVLHAVVPIFGDDITFANYSATSGLFEFIQHRYLTWSSRVFIEAILWLIAPLPVVWRVLDVLLLVALYYCAVKIFLKKQDFVACASVAAVVVIYPFWHMSTAGYIATTTNYLWPVALAFVAGYGLKKALDGVRMRWWE